MIQRGSALAALLLLAACGREEEPEKPSAPAVRAVPPAATAPAPPTPAPASARAPAELALDGEGLRFVDVSTGSTRLLPFGAPEAQALAALQPLRGAPVERSTNDECGAGPLAFADWPDNLQLVFQEGRFVGWSTDQRGLTTMSGLGVGSTRVELEGAYAAEIGESTLGTEFAAGGLGGLLSGPGKSARVTTLWAGAICAFR